MEFKFLIVPFVALIITQIFKLVVFAKNDKFSWKDFDSYGGMPSSHAAFMGAALIEAWQGYGFSSPVFAIITFITFIVLRDAVGLRQTIGKHSQMINQLVEDLPDKEQHKYSHLEPRQGHTYSQVMVGLLVGLVLALII